MEWIGFEGQRLRQDVGLVVKVWVHKLRKSPAARTGDEGKGVSDWGFPSWGYH